MCRGAEEEGQLERLPGATANVGIASYLFSANQMWWVAGVLGVIVGAVWNYAMSSIFTWKAS